MKPLCVDDVCSNPHACNDVPRALNNPSSTAALIARSASTFSPGRADFDRSIVESSAGTNGNCAKPMRASESAAEPGGVSETNT